MVSEKLASSVRDHFPDCALCPHFNQMFICSAVLALHLGRPELCVLWVVVLIITGYCNCLPELVERVIP